METADGFHKEEKETFILTYFSQESETPPVYEESNSFQYAFFLPGFVFSEYIKAQFYSSNRC